MSPRRVQGFTLIELMVVATIIGISVIAFTPSVIFATADRRAASAVAEVVRVGRRARAEAIGTQRAHLVWIRPGSGAQDTGVVQLLRGATAHCDIQPWLTLANACVVDDRRTCLENIDLNNTHWFHSPFQIRLRSVAQAAPNDLLGPLNSPNETNTYALCYQASGGVQWSTSALANPVSDFTDRVGGPAAGGAFVFVVGLWDTELSELTNTPRALSYPLGMTTPRRLR